jgi:hypothetical protein
MTALMPANWPAGLTRKVLGFKVQVFSFQFSVFSSQKQDDDKHRSMRKERF